jgi:DUF4097 and DUF4098 domain-containing protein YvlB
MKELFFITILALIGFSAYCGGIGEMKLVNEQEVNLNGVDTINVSYSNSRVEVLRGNASSLVIKEYMSKDNSDYYAEIDNSGNMVNIKNGKHPRFVIGINTFRCRVEIYVPESYMENLDVKTSNGHILVDSINGTIGAQTSNGSLELKNIEGSADVRTSNGSITIDSVNGNVTAENSNGSVELKNIDGSADVRTSNSSIRIDSVNGNVSAHTSSGSITLKNIDGAVDVKNSNGSITIDSVKGMIDAETSNSRIKCSLAEVSGDIKLETNNGSIDLELPRDLDFQFSARTRNGRVRTAFDDELSRPANDDHLYRGTIGRENDPSVEIDLETQNGSITVDWN